MVYKGGGREVDNFTRLERKFKTWNCESDCNGLTGLGYMKASRWGLSRMSGTDENMMI